MLLAILPLLQVCGSMCIVKARVDCRGKQIIPTFIAGRKPCAGLIRDELLLDEGALGPFINMPGSANLRLQHQRPPCAFCSAKDCRSSRVCRQSSIPAAQQIGGLAETATGMARMIDGISKTLRQFLIYFRIDICLQLQHVGRGELFLAGKPFPDTFVAIRRCPFESQWIGVAVRRDP
jgi:hypothetical protein